MSEATQMYRCGGLEGVELVTRLHYRERVEVSVSAFISPLATLRVAAYLWRLSTNVNEYHYGVYSKH